MYDKSKDPHWCNHCKKPYRDHDCPKDFKYWEIVALIFIFLMILFGGLTSVL